MVGHGSPPPGDRANHPGRQVGRTQQGQLFAHNDPQQGERHEIQSHEDEDYGDTHSYRALNAAGHVVASLGVSRSDTDYESDDWSHRHKVETLFSAKEGRFTAMTMLGIAQNRAMAETGEGLKTPSDLSHHSASLVRGLQQRGVVGTGASASTQNNITWASVRAPASYDPDYERMGTQEVRAGKRTVRDTIRRNPKGLR